ncbi:hypothetical protein L9F63_020640, partial [Diploptera punctata]
VKTRVTIILGLPDRNPERKTNSELLQAFYNIGFRPFGHKFSDALFINSFL